MPVATFQHEHLKRVYGEDLPLEEFARRLPLLGGEVDHMEGSAVAMEYFPNRPDLLVVEGAARALRAFDGRTPGRATYPVQAGKHRLIVEPAARAVRPHAALALVRGVHVDAAYLEALVEAQEKLCLSMGRRRAKVAIGLHDAAGLVSPYRYHAAALDDLRFVPLGDTVARSARDILAGHPKGKEYGHLVAKTCVAFSDASGKVLSMPPIINAAQTAVTETTRDILVDVTGTDGHAVHATLALLATCLAERGGTIESVTIEGPDGKTVAPRLDPVERILHLDDVERLLGPIGADAAALALRRMGHDCDAYDTKLHVRSPAWRFDLLHDVDWIEDIAVGHGYDRFAPRLPARQTFGARRAGQDRTRAVRAALTGQGWLEATTLSLTHPDEETTKWNRPAVPFATMANAAMPSQTVLRRRVVPALLQVAAANRHRSLPQWLFEVGETVQPSGTTWTNVPHVAGIQVDARAGWSTVWSAVASMARDAGLPVDLEPADIPGYVPGRSAYLRSAKGRIGEIGEVHPDTILAFGLLAPVAAFEFRLTP